MDSGLVGEPTRPPVHPLDAHARYRSQDKDGALQAMLQRYDTEDVPAKQLAKEAGVSVRTIYRRLRRTLQCRAPA